MMMKALIFDLDDTLVVEAASAESAFLETCRLAESRYRVDPQKLHATVRETCRRLWHQAPVHSYCLEIGISSWEGLWARFEGDNDNLKVLRYWSPIYRFNSWHEALLQHGIDDKEFATELAEEFPANRRKRHVVYDDVLPVLEFFSQSRLLGLLTNGVPDLQWEKIKGAGIQEYFDEIVISGEVGFGKPDRRIYETILSRLKVKLKDVIIIGNGLRSDVQGAQAIGMKAIWLNRTGKPRDNSVVPYFEVSTLQELKEAFQKKSVPPVETAVQSPGQ